jgi:uncharacterized protein
MVENNDQYDRNGNPEIREDVGTCDSIHHGRGAKKTLLSILPRPAHMHNLLKHIWRLPRNAFVLLITIYQHTLSPDHGPLRHLYTYGYCRHEPTCSEYGKNTILKRGIVIGAALLIIRLLSCHPWKKPSEKKILKTIEKASQE